MDFRTLAFKCSELINVPDAVSLFVSSVIQYSSDSGLDKFKSFLEIFKTFIRYINSSLRVNFIDAVKPDFAEIYRSEIKSFLARVSNMVALIENPNRTDEECIQVSGRPSLSKYFLEIKLENLDSTLQSLSEDELVQFLPPKIIAGLRNDYSVLRREFVSAMSKFK